MKGGETMNIRKGFTLIELLVVIAIIGVLSTLAVVSFQGARGKARDAQRLSAVKALQQGLEFYYNDNSSTYPKAVTMIKLSNDGDKTNCFDSGGFKIGDATTPCVDPIYLKTINDDPSPGVFWYYLSNGDATTAATKYAIAVKMEGNTNPYSVGWNCMLNDGSLGSVTIASDVPTCTIP